MYTVVGFFWTRDRGLGMQCLQLPFKLSDVIIEAPAWPTPSVPEVEMDGRGSEVACLLQFRAHVVHNTYPI